MPQVVAAGAGAWAGSAATTAWGAFWGAVVQVAVTAVVASAITKKRGFNAENRGTQVVLRSAIEAQRIIYGEAVCSGPLVYSRVSRDTVRAYERHRVPPEAPFTITVNFGSEFRNTFSVAQIVTSGDVTEGIVETPTFLSATAGAPGANEYSLGNGGVFTFNAARAGQDISIIYDHGGFEAANSWLHMVIPLAGHEVEAIGDVFFNSDVIASSDLDAEGNVVTGKYAGFAKIRKHLGAPGQTADGYLISVANGQWTSNHVGEGIAYIVVSLRRNQNVYSAGIPNIRAKVKGAKLYDPRTLTTAWSDNWALAVRDYLTREDGLNCDDAEVNDTLVSAAANVADEQVALDAVPTYQDRYTCDGIVSLDGRPMDVLKELLSAGAGTAVYAVSSWGVYAGAYVAPTRTLTVSDLRDQIAGAPDLPRRDIFNAVRGTFMNPDADWQNTSFPPVENPTYQAEDGGEQIFRDIELPFTKDGIRAQRLAKIVLERARQGATLAWPGKLTCFRINTWETVNVEFAQLGYAPKVFRCNSWNWQPGGGVDLGLQEEAAAAYDWNFGEATEIDLAPNTSLAGQGPLAQPGAPQVTEELYETRDGRGVGVRARLTWTRPADAYVAQYEPEFKLASVGAWTRLAPTADTTTSIEDMTPETYDFRVRAVDDFGRTSGYGQTRQAIVGLTVAPSAPTGLSIQAGGGTARLKLDPSPDLDVLRGGRVLVRFCHENVTPSWESGFSIGEIEGWPGDATQIDLPLKPGTYLMKFEDSTGHESETWAEIETKQASVLAFTTLQTITEDTTFPGTHSGTAPVDGVLTLGGNGMFDDIPDLDAEVDLDGFGGIASTGTYTFQTGTDLGTVSNVRITGRIEGGINNLLDQIDDRTGNVDDWIDWDGASFGGSSADAWIECRHTDDDPAGAPAWSEWKRLDAAEFAARGFQYRAILSSADAAYRPELSVLRVTVEEIL